MATINWSSEREGEGERGAYQNEHAPSHVHSRPRRKLHLEQCSGEKIPIIFTSFLPQNLSQVEIQTGLFFDMKFNHGLVLANGTQAGLASESRN